MRVLCLSPVGFFKGGAERSLFDVVKNPNAEFIIAVPEEGPIAERARELGHLVVVVPFGSVSTIRRPIRPLDLLHVISDWVRAANGLRRVAANTRADVIHTNGLKAHTIAVLARRLGSPPVVIHIRDIANTTLEKKFFKTIAKLANHAVLVSRACWPGEGTLPKTVSVVHNGTDVTTTPVLVSSPASSSLSVGICGRIHPAKGHHLLIDWVAHAKSHGHNLKLIVRGEAEDEDADYKLGLIKQINSLGLSEDVCFEGSKSGLQEIYGGLDIVVVPSSTPDPLPRSVMEAMSLGIPVAGYPAGGIPDMIIHGSTGWLVQDEIGFTQCIDDLSDQEKRLEIVSCAKAKIHADFSLEKLHSSLTTIYEKISAP